jgi:hypothetical protein
MIWVQNSLEELKRLVPKGSYMLLFRLRALIFASAVGMSAAAGLFAQEELRLSEEQMKDFLLKAEVVADKHTAKGVTSPYRLTMTNGKITHDARFQSVDERKFEARLPDGTPEYNFRDSWMFDIAAYELAKLLGLGDMMPVTVERKWKGTKGALTWWLPVQMDEATRLSKKIAPPDVDAWNRQMYKKWIFTELVYDTDPNTSNVLIAKDWHIWMIDFTRAFRLNKTLRQSKNVSESKCERQLLERLRKLDRAELAQKTKGYLEKGEIDGVMARREKIVAIFDDLIAKKGEAEVLYDDPVIK